MAAVTVVSKNTRHVVGDLRIVFAQLTVATTGDTWAIPGIHQVIGFAVTPDTARTCGATVSGTTLTLNTAAGDVRVVIWGK